MPPQSDRDKNQEIQILRSIAIIFVLLQHAVNYLPSPVWFVRFMQSGHFWTGVDLFFGISGFVIAKSILGKSDRIAEFRLTIKDTYIFWIKRFFRIIPAAWFWALLVLAISPFILKTPAMQPHLVLPGALAAMFGYANFYMASCVANQAYELTCANPYANSIYWSLSREEQFYLVLSVLFLFLRFRFILLIGLAGAFAFAFIPKPVHSLAWHLRFDGLYLGVACYALTRTRFHQMSWALLQHRFVRLALLTASVAAIPLIPNWFAPFDTSFIAVAAAVALWITSFDCTLGRGLISQGLAWLGDRSYALYLCHMPAYVVTREIMMRAGFEGVWSQNIGFVTIVPLALALSLMLAEATYRLVDLPTTRYGRQLAERVSRGTASWRTRVSAAE